MRLEKVFELTAGAVDTNLFARLPERIDPAWIMDALPAKGPLAVRRRKLPAEVVVWTVVGACLFGERSLADIVRDYGLTALSRRKLVQTPPTSGAIARARKRVPWESFREVNRTAARTWLADPSVGDHRYRQLHVLAVDGTTLDLSDTPSNNEGFGKPVVKEGASEAAFPKARAVVLMDTRTRMILDAEIGKYAHTEFDLLEADPTEGLLARIPDDTLTIFDRYYRSWGMLHRLRAKGSERHWLLRARTDLVTELVKNFGPGDRLVKIFPGSVVRKEDPTIPPEMVVREVTYVRGNTTFRIITSLVDPKKYPAKELASLYAERWDLELAFDDIKTEQRQAVTTLRSRSADGVRQEFYGLLLAHNLVRYEAARAAALLGLPPSRMSFHVALRAVGRHLHLCSVTTAPSRIGDWESQLLSTLAAMILPRRRSKRQYPRALKRTVARYPKKDRSKPQALA